MNVSTLTAALSIVFGNTLTTATNVYAKNGNTNGIISIANLQSVLGGGVIGVNQPGYFNSSNNLNSKPIGIYTINISSGIPSNCPESTSGFFVGFGGGGSGDWGLQLFFPNGSSRFYFRTHVSSTFYSWNKVEV